MSATIRPKSHLLPFANLVHGAWLDWVICLLGILALFATPLQMLRLATNLAEPVRIGIATVFAMSAGLFIWRHALAVTNMALVSLRKLDAIPLWAIAVGGLALRVAWILLFPAEAGSDGKIYLTLASQIAQGEPYETSGTLAYWPVGYPLYLAGWFTLLDATPVNYLISNLFLFLVGFAGIAYLGNLLAGSIAGKVAALLFSLWPNLVFNTATPEKEMLVLALLPWATSLIFRSLKRESPIWAASIAGFLFGAITLVQPSFQFLPFVGAILIIGLSTSWRAGFINALLLVACAAIVIAPWTIRNYQIFDRFVLVATNGGDNLYRANNPLATGGYTPEGEKDLSNLSEIERDVAGRKFALEWIRANPADFTALAVEKQIRFMGDDAVGVYNTLKVGKASEDGRIYSLLKAAANGWWMLVWVILIAATLASRQLGTSLPNLGRAPIWLWLYLFTLHSIFESAGKYHLTILWVPCVLLAVYASSLLEGRKQ